MSIRSNTLAALAMGLATLGAGLAARQSGAPTGRAAAPQTPAQPRPLPTLVAEVQTMFNNIKSNMIKAVHR
jgi:F0F1-type ATP synthase membrane subunit c/vacuolar-type H+-ATPase subunit K